MNKIKNILILYFLAVLIFLFVSLPLFDGYLRQRSELDGKIKELAQEDLYVDEIIKMESELLPYDPILNEIERGLPVGPGLPSLIRYLETLTAGAGLHLVNIRPFSTADVVGRTHLKETTLEMTVVGNSYESLKTFIQELERSIRLINIASVKISPIANDNNDNGLRFSLSLSLKTYSH